MNIESSCEICFSTVNELRDFSISACPDIYNFFQNYLLKSTYLSQHKKVTKKRKIRQRIKSEKICFVCENFVLAALSHSSDLDGLSDNDIIYTGENLSMKFSSWVNHYVEVIALTKFYVSKNHRMVKC